MKPTEDQKTYAALYLNMLADEMDVNMLEIWGRNDGYSPEVKKNVEAVAKSVGIWLRHHAEKQRPIQYMEVGE